MPFGIRTASCLLADNAEQIEKWRASLSEAQRSTLNHPEVVIRCWRRATAPKAVPRRRVTANGKVGHDVPLRVTGEMIRRGAKAMQATGGRDLFVMAAACFASLTIGELIDLINEPVRTRQPRKVAPVEAMTPA